MSPKPDFFSKHFLLNHCQSILAFYDPKVVDQSGGYFQNYFDNGELFDPGFRQLVSSTRIVVNYAQAHSLFAKPEYLTMALHGLDYVENVHWRSDSQSYAWTLLDHQPQDMTQQAYGYAFVLLAYAAVHKNGLRHVTDKIKATYDLLESRFWQAEYGLYADEISSDGQLSDYRGQNANMHLCEAMIMAFEATGDELYLQRALLLAENISHRQASLTDGLVWEHYTPHFAPDWLYNKDDPKNLYRPWGFQPGHQTEWSKLLLSLYRHKPSQDLLDRARMLFDRAFETSWDAEFGGMIYGFAPDGKWCDDDKYFWVQAESFAAAAMLYQLTGQDKYQQQYQALWQYSWQHMVDHQYGAWFRVLTRDNSKYSKEKSAAGAKCDYHTLGACFEVLRVLRDSSAQ
jgi:mannose/cellobiose epimerase-like protein (N-acyl-D-glucosamine 2-epimerase family)